jgi:hypothetical protein
MTERRCFYPECTAYTAVPLLENGRPGMALSLMRGPPEAIRDAVAAHGGGVRDARRSTTSSGRRSSGAEPGFRRQAAEPRERVRRLGPERVAEVPAVPLDDLQPLPEGGVSVARSASHRSRKAA